MSDSENSIETALKALDLAFRRHFDDATPRALLALARRAMEERDGVDPDKVAGGDIEFKAGEPLKIRLHEQWFEYPPDQ